MRKITAGILPVLALACSAATAGAQVCAGLPTVDGQFSFGGSVHFPRNADQWGVEASYDAEGPYSVFGGVTVVSGEDGGGSDDAVGLGGAYVVRSSPLGPRAQVCPTASVGYNNSPGLGTATSLALGVGVGSAAPATATERASFHPYVLPQVVFSQFQADDDSPLPVEDGGDIVFAISGGVLVGFGSFWVGPVAAFVLEDGADPTIGIRAGIRL